MDYTKLCLYYIKNQTISFLSKMMKSLEKFVIKEKENHGSLIFIKSTTQNDSDNIKRGAWLLTFGLMETFLIKEKSIKYTIPKYKV